MSSANASIMARIGVDHAGVTSGMAQAVAEVKRGAAKISGGLQFEREGKAKRNIVALSADLIGARNASDVFYAGLFRLQDVFKNGLLVGSVLGIGAAIYQTATRANEEFANMKKGMEDFHKSASLAITSFDSSQLVASLKAGEAEIEKLKTSSYGAADALAAMFTKDGVTRSQRDRIIRSNVRAMQNEQERAGQTLLDIAAEEQKILTARTRGQDELADSMQDELDIRKEIARINATPGLSQERKDSLGQSAVKASDSRRLLKDQQAAAARIVKDQRDNQANLEKVSRMDDEYKSTLGNLVAHGHGHDANTARRAARHEKLSERRALLGDLAGAKAHHLTAKSLKDGIKSLKDSEKGVTFKDALDQSAVLKQIQENTAKDIVNK